MKRVFFVIVAVVLVAVAVNVALRREPPPRAAKPVTIEAVRFMPPDLTLALGDAVVWTNADPFPHNVTAPAGQFSSGDIAAGQTWRYQPAARGTFEYACTLHPGMKGTLRVE